MTDLDKNRELTPGQARRGIGVSVIVAVIAAAIVVALLFKYAPWSNQTASDSANSNSASTLGRGAGGQSGPAPTMPGQSAPASGTDSR
jgi:hypothetical protein